MSRLPGGEENDQTALRADGQSLSYLTAGIHLHVEFASALRLPDIPSALWPGGLEFQPHSPASGRPGSRLIRGECTAAIMPFQVGGRGNGRERPREARFRAARRDFACRSGRPVRLRRSRSRSRRHSRVGRSSRSKRTKGGASNKPTVVTVLVACEVGTRRHGSGGPTKSPPNSKQSLL